MAQHAVPTQAQWHGWARLEPDPGPVTPGDDSDDMTSPQSHRTGRARQESGERTGQRAAAPASARRRPSQGASPKGHQLLEHPARTCGPLQWDSGPRSRRSPRALGPAPCPLSCPPHQPCQGAAPPGDPCRLPSLWPAPPALPSGAMTPTAAVPEVRRSAGVGRAECGPALPGLGSQAPGQAGPCGEPCPRPGAGLRQATRGSPGKWHLGPGEQETAQSRRPETAVP